MKVTVENIKGLNKDIKVFIDKKTMILIWTQSMKKLKGLLI